MEMLYLLSYPSIYCRCPVWDGDFQIYKLGVGIEPTTFSLPWRCSTD